MATLNQECSVLATEGLAVMRLFVLCALVRRLFSELPPQQRESMIRMKQEASQMIAVSRKPYVSPRLLAFASEGKGRRTLVDIAVPNPEKAYPV